MRRFLSSLVAISVLLTNMAWAADYCDDPVRNRDVSQLNATSVPAIDFALNGSLPPDRLCDHFCHASGQLLGLFARGPLLARLTTSSISSAAPQTLDSWIAAPSDPPPRT